MIYPLDIAIRIVFGQKGVVRIVGIGLTWAEAGFWCKVEDAQQPGGWNTGKMSKRPSLDERRLKIVDGRLGCRSEDSRDVKHEWRVRSLEQFDRNFKHRSR